MYSGFKHAPTASWSHTAVQVLHPQVQLTQPVQVELVGQIFLSVPLVPKDMVLLHVELIICTTKSLFISFCATFFACSCHPFIYNLITLG